MKIAILTGGDSSEREIAKQSAQNVIKVLERKYNLAVFDFPKDLDKFLKNYKSYKVVVPIFHGPGGESGVIQGFLQTLNLSFIFSAPEVHAIAMDKFLTKCLAANIGLRIADDQILESGQALKYSKLVVVKPLTGGSSLGIQIVNSQQKLDRALAEAFQYDNKVLVEDYIEGQEFTVSIIEKAGQTFALPVIEIRSKNDFFDYQSKYDANLVNEICPAEIDISLTKNLQAQALKIHQALGAKHLSRSDFIVKAGQIYFLETNTIPGMTNDSLLPKSIKAGGENFGDLLNDWIKSAII